MKAKVAQTYGWTDHYIRSLSYKVFLEYWLAITPIEAGQAMSALRVSAYPHMKKGDAKKTFEEIKKQIDSNIKKNGKKSLSVKDIAENLARKLQNGR